MWDRLLVDCNIATLEERPGDALGLIENAASASGPSSPGSVRTKSSR